MHSRANSCAAFTQGRVELMLCINAHVYTKRNAGCAAWRASDDVTRLRMRSRLSNPRVERRRQRVCRRSERPTTLDDSSFQYDSSRRGQHTPRPTRATRSHANSLRLAAQNLTFDTKCGRKTVSEKMTRGCTHNAARILGPQTGHGFCATIWAGCSGRILFKFNSHSSNLYESTTQ